MSITCFAAVAGCVAALGVVAVDAQPTGSDAEGRAWLERQIEARSRVDDLEGVSVAWRIERRYVPGSAELAELRARVHGHPDHPDRALLSDYERRGKGKDFNERRLFAFGPDRTRLADSRDGDPNSYFDVVLTPDARWGMSAVSLAVLQPTGEMPPNRDFRIAVNAARDELAVLLSGGLSSLLGATTMVNDWQLKGDQWEANLTAERPPRHLRIWCGGTWSVDERERTIEQVVIEIDRPGGRSLATYTSQNWRFDGVMGCAVAGLVSERMDGESRSERRLTLLEASSLSADEFRRLCAIPELNGVDPVRGSVTFTTLNDFRGLEEVRHTLFPDGSVNSVRRSEQPAFVARERYRIMGWIVLGVLVVSIILLRIRAGRAG